MISIKKLENFEDLTLFNIEDMLKESLTKVDNEIQNLTNVKKNIKEKKNMLKEIQRLKQNTYSTEKFDGEVIIPFDYLESEKTQLYIKDPYNYVALIDSKDFSKEQRGICVNRDIKEVDILYENKNSNFITFLAEEYVHRNYQSVTRFIIKSYNISI